MEVQNKLRCLEPKENDMMRNVINSIRIAYIGISKDSPKYRLADVTYNEELTHADLLMDLFIEYVEKHIGYKVFFAEQGSYVFEMQDYEEYKTFSHEMQKVKKEVRCILR